LGVGRRPHWLAAHCALRTAHCCALLRTAHCALRTALAELTRQARLGTMLGTGRSSRQQPLP
jgi:hypothetical protein